MIRIARIQVAACRQPTGSGCRQTLVVLLLVVLGCLSAPVSRVAAQGAAGTAGGIKVGPVKPALSPSPSLEDLPDPTASAMLPGPPGAPGAPAPASTPSPAPAASGAPPKGVTGAVGIGASSSGGKSSGTGSSPGNASAGPANTAGTPATPLAPGISPTATPTPLPEEAQGMGTGKHRHHRRSPATGAGPSVGPSAAPGATPAPAHRRRSRHHHGRSSIEEGAMLGKHFKSAVDCAACHDQAYDEWKTSMHAQAWTDPLFQRAYRSARRDLGARAREMCVACHAPVAAMTGDPQVRKVTSKEGITCEVCHAMTAVDQTFYTPLHYYTDPGIERGPFRDSTAPHAVARSDLLGESLMCAGCHQAKIHASDAYFTFSTYDEWKNSPQNTLPPDEREGYGRPEVTTTCQECHMVRRPGPAAKDGPYRSEARSHLCQGANAEGMLATGLSFHMTARRSLDRKFLNVDVQTINRAAGHSIPGDLPDRRLVVEITGIKRDMTVMFTDRRVYGKILKDAKGRVPARFWLADGIQLDNRIAPGEVRSEKFTFALDGDLAEVKARLNYYHYPEELSRAYGGKPEPILIDEQTATFAP